MEEEKLDAERIYGMLTEQYFLPEWVLIPELRGSTAYYNMRSIDAYAMSCWSKPTPGYSIAFEIKISRQDFMNEIHDPEKRKRFVDNSNQFYYVVTPNVCRPEEIPTECGLMYAGKGLQIKKIAPQRILEKGYDPKFVASLIRNIVDKNKEYIVSKRKLFKYAGKELNRQDMIEMIESEHKERYANLKSVCEKEIRKTFFEDANNEYNKAMAVICKELGLNISISKLQKGWRDTDDLYDIDHIVGTIQRIITNRNENLQGVLQAKIQKIKDIVDSR